MWFPVKTPSFGALLQDVPVGINRAHPLNNYDIQRVIVFHQGAPRGAYDLVTGEFMSPGGTIFSKDITSFGPGEQFGSSSGTHYYDIPVRGETVGSFTVLWAGHSDDNSGAQAIYMRDATGAGGTIPLWRTSANTADLRIGGTDYTAAGSWSPLEDIVVCAVSKASSHGRVFTSKGGLVLNGGSPGATALVSPWKLHRNGTAVTTGAPNAVANILVICALPVPDELAMELVQRPFDILEPLASNFWVAVSAAGGFKPYWVRRRSAIIGGGLNVS